MGDRALGWSTISSIPNQRELSLRGGWRPTKRSLPHSVICRTRLLVRQESWRDPAGARPARVSRRRNGITRDRSPVRESRTPGSAWGAGRKASPYRDRGPAMTALVLCNEFLIHHTDRELLSSRHGCGEPEPAPRTPPDRWSNRGPGRCAAKSSPATLTTEPHASAASNRRNGRSARSEGRAPSPGQPSAVRLPASDPCPCARPSSLGVLDRGACWPQIPGIASHVPQRRGQ